MLLALLLAFAAEDPDRLFGAPLPPGSRKLDEPGRVASSRNYDDTIEFYEKLYKGSPGFRFRPIISAPGIKAVHFQNTKSSGGWSGLNIYDNGRTRIYVLKADSADAPAGKPEPKKK